MGAITNTIEAVKARYDARHGGDFQRAVSEAKAGVVRREAQGEGKGDSKQAPTIEELTAEHRQMQTEIAEVKAAAHCGVLQALLGGGLPLALDREDGRVVTIRAALRQGDMLRLDVDWTLDGEPMSFDGPWYIGNPPCLVEDPEGDIVREYIIPALWGRPEQVVTQRFREDPMAALIEMIDSVFLAR